MGDAQYSLSCHSEVKLKVLLPHKPLLSPPRCYTKYLFRKNAPKYKVSLNNYGTTTLQNSYKVNPKRNPKP